MNFYYKNFYTFLKSCQIFFKGSYSANFTKYTLEPALSLSSLLLFYHTLNKLFVLFIFKCISSSYPLFPLIFFLWLQFLRHLFLRHFWKVFLFFEIMEVEKSSMLQTFMFEISQRSHLLFHFSLISLSNCTLLLVKDWHFFSYTNILGDYKNVQVFGTGRILVSNLWCNRLW